MASTPASVCIVSLYAWPLFDPSSRGVFGGSEVRIATIARELARRGKLDVHMIVYDLGQGLIAERAGIKFHAWPEPPPADVHVDRVPERFKPSRWVRNQYAHGGWRRLVFAAPHGAFRSYAALVRFLTEMRRKTTAIATISGHLVDRNRFAILDSVDPAVVAVHGATAVAAEVVHWSRIRGRPSLFIAGSDADFDPRYKRNPHERNMYNDLGGALASVIEDASTHALQTDRQASMLREVYGREGQVIPNPFSRERSFVRDERQGTVLWIGKADGIKRPEIALELARRIPDAKFTVVMNPMLPQVEEKCRDLLADLRNVEVIPFVPFDEVESLFARASVFLNTSAFEGFPNTFLQAAKYEVPIASLEVDPMGMLAAGAGIHARGSLDRLEEGVRALLADPQSRAAAGAAAFEHLHKHHDMETIIGRYEQLLLAMSERRQS